jgi:hypothetical protein
MASKKATKWDYKTDGIRVLMMGYKRAIKRQQSTQTDERDNRSQLNTFCNNSSFVHQKKPLLQ